MANIREKFKNAWNAFRGRSPTQNWRESMFGSSSRPDRHMIRYGHDRSMIMTIYNQIGVDCAAINIKHVRLNDKDKYKETIDDSLNQALNRDANVDQTGRAMILDGVISMLDEGCVAFVPIVTDGNPQIGESFKVEEIRTGKVTEWFPRQVRVDVYNEDIGTRQEIIVDKRYTPIVENPFYTTMNTPNSTAQRLSRVLSQLDRANEAYNPGKLDIIVQLPYQLKTDSRKKYAEDRRKSIEDQLTGSAYGIAYTDGTEKVIQLNRSLENNLWTQSKDLTEQLFNQLGLCKAIFDGTADEQTMLNYYNRTIEPILTAITEEMERKWISKTARAQRQAIRFYRDPFKLVPVLNLAEIADKFTRNEIMSSNEIRSIMGLQPDPNPKSDMLINANLNMSKDQMGELGLTDGGGEATEEKSKSTEPQQTTAPFVLSERVGAMRI